MHRERARTTLADLAALQRLGVTFTPFLEIGAGSVQRSATLINHYEADGVATDISPRSLQDAPYMLMLLNHARLPMLVSCDAHHLPFEDNSFRFVFAYQTLHHFSNPVPVLAECHRVLCRDGHLFFNEEPMDSSLRRLLRGNRLLTEPPTPLQRAGRRLGVEKLFWDDGARERALGMTEARFDLDLWRTALRPFHVVELEVNRKLRLRPNLYRSSVRALLSGVIGGNVRGLCRKADGEPLTTDFRSRLKCLDCHATALSQDGESSGTVSCGHCGRRYPLEQGVIRMLPRSLDAELYPETPEET